MTSTSSTARVEELVRAYDQLGIPPKFSAQEARVLIGVWRALAEGAPVTLQRVAEIAAGAGMTEGEATEFLKWMSEKDDDGNILGTMGLTHAEWSQIKFNVDGNQLRVSGLRRVPAGSDVRRLNQMEIAFGPFERTIQIDQAFERDAVTAHLEDGFLDVTVPKKARGGRRIKVESG